MDKFYPIGTVVKLKATEDNLFMIVTHMASNDNKEIREYVATRYPTGIGDDTMNYFFNHEDISEVVHMGYLNEDHETYNELLKVLQTNFNANSGSN